MIGRASVCIHQTLGQHGYSKDHRPDLRQMILAVLLDGDGRPVCSENRPGRYLTDVSILTGELTTKRPGSVYTR
jgi:transposase